MFDLLGNKSEFVLGPTTSATSRTSRTLHQPQPRQDQCVSISTRPRVAKPDYSYTKNDHEEQSELGLYGKVTWRLLEPLAVITGARVSGTIWMPPARPLSSGAQSGESSAFNGKLTPRGGRP